MADKHPSPSVLWLRSFEAAARTLNFTAAGNEIGLTQAAISQHIKLLEAELGASLFRRLQRGVELTAEGAAYLPHVQTAFRSLDRSTADLFGLQSMETLRITGPVSFMTLWLAPRLAGFQHRFPNVRLEMATIYLPADYLAQEYDFDIRFGMGDFIGRTSHRLTSETFLPAAAPALTARLEGVRDWPSMPLLSVSGARELWPGWFSAAGLPPPAQPRLRFDSFITALQAACEGAGVLLASRPLVDSHLADGRLIALSDFEMAADTGHFITYEAGRALKPLHAAFLDWMSGQAQATGR